MLVQRLFTTALCAALACGTLGATQSPPPFPPSPSAAATPTPDPALVARAKAVFGELTAGKIDPSEITPDAVADYTPAKMKQAAGTLAPLGTPVTFELQNVAEQDGITAYLFLVTFGNSTKLNFIYAVDAKGKIASLRVTQAP